MTWDRCSPEELTMKPLYRSCSLISALANGFDLVVSGARITSKLKIGIGHWRKRENSAALLETSDFQFGNVWSSIKDVVGSG